MKTTLVTFAAATAFASYAHTGELMPPPQSAPIETTDASPILTGSVSLGYDSIYNFRGVDFGKHAPWGSLDLNLEVSPKVSLNLGTWYIHPVEQLAGSDETDELDLYAFVNTSLGNLDVSLGGTAFFFTEADTTAQELGVALAYGFTESVGVGFDYFYDFETEGSYLQGSLNLSHSFTEIVGAELSGGASYGESYYGVSGGNHVFVSLALPLQLSETVALSPYVAATWAIDALESLGEDDHFYGGASISVSF
jgi:hypothetical protein